MLARGIFLLSIFKLGHVLWLLKDTLLPSLKKKKNQFYIEVILALIIANISIRFAVCLDDFLWSCLFFLKCLCIFLD